jgi:hypothetical protein
MAEADLAAVVVSFQNEATLAACLDALSAELTLRELWVVDNASRDGGPAISAAWAAVDGRVHCLRNAENLGYAAACNQAAAKAGAPILVFVNPDAVPAFGLLPALAARLHADPAVGLVAGVPCDERGQADPAAWRRDLSLRRLWKEGGSTAALQVPEQPVEFQDVEAASGALFAIRSDLFSRLGGFDAAYRLHVEDLDLCRRVRDAGFRVEVANRARFLHRRGHSRRARPLWSEWQKLRGTLRYFDKFEAPGLSRLRRGGLRLAARLAFLPRLFLRLFVPG